MCILHIVFKIKPVVVVVTSLIFMPGGRKRVLVGRKRVLVICGGRVHNTQGLKVEQALASKMFIQNK